MKMFRTTYVIGFILLANVGLLCAQQTRLELGNKYFDQFDYKKAIILYEELDNSQKNWKIQSRLGDCYYYTSRPEKALDYYEKAIAQNSDISTSYLLKYALCLQSAGKAEDVVIAAFQAYLDKTGKSNGLSAKALSERTSIVEETASMNQLEHLSINSKYSDFGTFIYNDTLYFSSSRKNPEKKPRFNRRLYKWTGQPFLDVYSSAITRNGDSAYLQNPIPPLSFENINTVAHEASVTIDSTGKTMFFSRGMLKTRTQMKYNKQGTSNLKLQRATLINNRWTVTDADRRVVDTLDYEHYSVGNPTLSPKGNRLFFTSCAPFEEAHGQTDIYYVDILKDGTFSSVKSIPGINTGGRESFPYVSKEGTLYFSSDGIVNGKFGLGLLDIYKVEHIDEVISSGTEDIKIEHLQEPINSAMDDFALLIDEHALANGCEEYWYFSSNRRDSISKADDDIYRVRMKKTQILIGSVTDASNHQPLTDASVDLIDTEGQVLETKNVDLDGMFSFDVDCGQTYRLRGNMARYYDDLKEVQVESSRIVVSLELQPFPCEITVDRIEFDLSSDLIREDAKQKILQVLEILLTNPEVSVSIESHTDSQGTEVFNLGLSERRAKNTKDYLIAQGVKETQIRSAKGFGEHCLLISDDEINSAPPAERKAMHEKNRRSRFILDCNEVQGCDENWVTD